MNPKPEHFTALMGKYKLSHPVSPEDQRYILTRRRASLKNILKKKGAYGFAIGALIAINVLFRNIGLKLTLLQTNIIAGLTAAAVSTASVAGTYTAANYIKKKYDESIKTGEGRERSNPMYDKNRNGIPDLKTDNQIKKYYNKLEEMYLDDGSRLIGAVIYQDRKTIRIHTVHGVIELPVRCIKTIKLR